ncbi:hypothetical protein [Aurantimonas sp. 22II-16-19i]|uniref:hypothetical protein n=1 Tax=Aurantimonas sp. 22II-16-19i TaxID=1317114 RepID=UPI0009F7AD5C|nr:hypothetical protein [Aurantimonas sp. 22II-16-19i]ORE92856.1 hypothetical protein ATO4_16725 [Aurantimonas sp. 22II-16-19i]
MLASAERNAIDAMEPRWKSQGYQLIREPDRSDLPDFLGGLEPDAIAVGPEPSLLIEVMGTGKAAEYKLDQIRKLLGGRSDWRLEVVYAPSDRPVVGPVHEAQIAEALASAGRLAGQEPRAALLLAWSAFEAAMRRRFPNEAKGPVTAGLLALLDAGEIGEADHRRLLGLWRIRNALAHGQLDVAIVAEDAIAVANAASRALVSPTPA